MSEENISDHLSVAMTTETDDVQTTAGGTGPASSSSELLLYFRCAVVFTGVFGAAANALIAYAMIASKQHKKQLLIFNQNIFDLCSCLLPCHNLHTEALQHLYDWHAWLLAVYDAAQ